MPLMYQSFINLVFIGVIALFPVVNPIGSAFIISPYLANLSSAEKRVAVGRITGYAFLLCTVSLFAGPWILDAFGLSIPVIQLAGGIMICKIGWEFLSSDQKATPSPDLEHKGAVISEYSKLLNKLFYPITFPLTTGAGTISVLFTLSASSSAVNEKEHYLNLLAIMVSILIMCALIFIFYLNTKRILNYLGTNGENIVNRISAFLIFCVGLQIAVNGIRQLFFVH